MARGETSVLREGVIAGCLGAAVVAVWFLVFDLARGKPLLTPALLGAIVFYGANDPAALEISVGPILGYTVLHGAAFVLFGIVASVLIAGAERAPMFLFAVVILSTAFEVFFFGAVVIGAKWVLDDLAGWTIFVGNLLASAAMLAYFFTGHRALARRLIETFAEDD